MRLNVKISAFLGGREVLKHLKTAAVVLVLVMLSIITAAVIKNDTAGIKIDVVIHTENGIIAEAVENLKDIPNPQKKGYKFCGWFDNPELYGESVTALPTRGRVTLYPKWEADVFAVAFDTRGGTEIPALTGVYDTPFAFPNPPTKIGNTFTGWFIDKELTIPYVLNRFGAEDITLYAQWTANPITITFCGENGEDYGKKSVQYGEPFGKLPNPTREGYTFIAWVDESGSKAESTESIKSPQDITLYAQWEAKTNALILDSNGAEVQSIILRVCTGGEVTLPSNAFERSGFSFAGWAADPDGDVLYSDGDVFCAKTEEVNFLYAIWTPFYHPPTLQANVSDSIYGEPLKIDAIINTTGNNIDYQYKRADDEEYFANAPIDAGAYHLKMTALADSGYLAIAVYPFTIHKRTINIEAGMSFSRPYDGGTSADISDANFAISNKINNDDIGLSWQTAVYNSPRADEANKVMVKGLSVSNPNYELGNNHIDIPANIQQRGAKVYINSASKVYGESDPELTCKTQGLLEGDNLNAVLTREAGESVGSYEISAVFTNPDYNVVIVPNFMVITARALTITAENATKVYDAPDPLFTYILEGGISKTELEDEEVLPFGESLLGELERIQGEDTGSYAITLGTLFVPNAKNYAVTFVGGALTIVPADAVIDTQNIPTLYSYNGSPHSISGAEALGGGRVTYLNNSFTTAGEHQITINAESSRNYKSGSVIFAATVLPAELVVIYEGENIVYGDIPCLTINISGFVEGETAAVLDSLPSISTGRLGAGEHTLTPFGGAADNYTFRYTAGTLFVAPRLLTLSIAPQTKVYGQPDPIFTYNMEGLLLDDELYGNLKREVGESVGNYQIYSTLEHPDYEIFAEPASLEILPNRISVTQSEWGRITPENENQKDIIYGASKTITSIPNAGYSVVSFVVDGATIPAAVGQGEQGIYVFPSVIQSATITAVFAPNTNLLVFDGNGNTDGLTPSQMLCTGEGASLNANGFIKDGYIFAGWAELPQGNIAYAQCAHYTMGCGESYTLYARWAAIGQDTANTGGDCLTVQKTNDYSLAFSGEVDVSMLLDNAGYWLAAEVEFPTGMPVLQAEVGGDDNLIFVTNSDNPYSLLVYLNVNSERIGREFYFDIKWSEASCVSTFTIEVKDTLTFAELYLIGVEAETLDLQAVDYQGGALTVQDGQVIVKIVATFNKDIAAVYPEGMFGFEEGGGFALTISENTATFTAQYTALQGEYLFVGYTPSGEEAPIFPLTDKTGMLNLKTRALVSLNVLRQDPLPFSVTDINAGISNSHKSQSYADGVLTISAGASLTFITITMSENFILGTNYSFAILTSDLLNISDFSLEQTGNVLILSFHYQTIFLLGTYSLRFRNSRGTAYMNAPLTGTETGETFDSQILISINVE